MEKLKLKLDKYDLQLVSYIISNELDKIGVDTYGRMYLTGMQIMLSDNLSEVLATIVQKQFPIKDEYTLKLSVGNVYALYHLFTKGLEDKKVIYYENALIPVSDALTGLTIFQTNQLSMLLMVLDKYLLQILKREKRNVNQYRIKASDQGEEAEGETLRGFKTLVEVAEPAISPDLEEKFEKWEQEAKIGLCATDQGEETLRGFKTIVEVAEPVQPTGALSARLIALKKLAYDVATNRGNTPVSSFKTLSAGINNSFNNAKKNVVFQAFDQNKAKRTCFSNCTEECRQCTTSYVKKLAAVIHSASEPNDNFQSCLSR